MKPGFANWTRPKKQSNQSQDLVIPSKARNLLLAGSGNAADRRADSSPANAVSE
jgi:hypothetical protein